MTDAEKIKALEAQLHDARAYVHDRAEIADEMERMAREGVMRRYALRALAGKLRVRQGRTA